MRAYLLGMFTYAAVFVPFGVWRDRAEYVHDLAVSWWVLRKEVIHHG